MHVRKKGEFKVDNDDGDLLIIKNKYGNKHIHIKNISRMNKRRCLKFMRMKMNNCSAKHAINVGVTNRQNLKRLYMWKHCTRTKLCP